MRTTLFMLLSACALVLAPLAASAADEENAAPVNNHAASAPASAAASAPPETAREPLPPDATQEQRQADCRARLKEYQDSLACFAPYRHSAHVIDVEAYKHCKVVAEPTDCLAEGMQ